mgnify:CR=1 FL=1
MEESYKILAITGIRSEYDILYPVLDEIRSAGHDLKIAVTGAHLSDHHGNTQDAIVQDGFAALSSMPGWYQYSLGGIVSASIGMRGVSKYFGGKK